MADEANITNQQSQASIKALARTVAQLTGQSEQEALPFAEQYGPAMLRWGVQLDLARKANDTASVKRLTDDIKLAIDVAIEDAGDLGINIQLAGESTLFGAFAALTHAAVFFA